MGPNGKPNGEGTVTERSSGRRDVRRVSIAEAAARLGVSKDAVRMRIRRGTLRSEKTDGRVYVWLNEDLNADQDTVHPQGQVQALLQEKEERIEELRDQVHHFREILAEERDARRRADTIIAQLTQANAALASRVPELEAPASGASAEPRESPQSAPGTPQEPTPSEPAEGSPREPQERAASQPWWRRVFGG